MTSKRQTGKSNGDGNVVTAEIITSPQTGQASSSSLVVARGLEYVPELIAFQGKKATKRFITFFTDNIRNPNTRRAYHARILEFYDWCHEQNLAFNDVESFHVSAYIEWLLAEGKAKSSVKQALAAIRMLYDWLIVGQICSINPAQAVRGPKLVTKKGKTPVLSDKDVVSLLDAIDTSHVVGLRDRALIATMVYSFGRIGAVTAMNVRDYYPNGKRWWLRLHEKGGKDHEIPAHHKLEEYLDAYLDAAGIREEPRSPLFQTTRGRSRQLTGRRLEQKNAWDMLQRRLTDAGISALLCNHSFRATGITNYLKNGGNVETAQRMAAHESARTTGLYDRRSDEVDLEEIERVRF